MPLTYELCSLFGIRIRCGTCLLCTWLLSVSVCRPWSEMTKKHSQRPLRHTLCMDSYSPSCAVLNSTGCSFYYELTLRFLNGLRARFSTKCATSNLEYQWWENWLTLTTKQTKSHSSFAAVTGSTAISWSSESQFEEIIFILELYCDSRSF